MLLLELQNVVTRQAVVAILGGLRRDIDDDRGRDELLERKLVGRPAGFGEMMGRIEVRATVLGSAETVGGIEITAGGRGRSPPG